MILRLKMSQVYPVEKLKDRFLPKNYCSGIECAHLSDMSTTTKSPKKVVQAAYRIAKFSIPEYAHR